jgi:glycosyltransferase involved in cell wall biosynthesis
MNDEAPGNLAAAGGTAPSIPARPRLTICWPEVSGYMASCWRALAATGRMDLTVLAFKSGGPGSGAAFHDSVMHGLNCQLLDAAAARDRVLIRRMVLATRPQVLCLPGWSLPAYRALAFDRDLSGVKLIMTMDTPWEGRFRQRLARLKIGRYLDRMDRVIVAGERAWQYTRHLKIPESKVRRGVYGFDYQALTPLFEQRRQLPGGWPRTFLLIARYIPMKALDVLVEAYGCYRRQAARPWNLVCCGRGPLAHLLQGVEGIEDHGFVQPDDLGGVFLHAGAFILPSRHEPWGVAIGEAAAAGLPVVCSEACGAAVELVRPHFNGLLVPTGDVQALAAALGWIDQHSDVLPEWGARGHPLAAAFSAQAWAQRWLATVEELV